jgi:hypothetical protein
MWKEANMWPNLRFYHVDSVQNITVNVSQERWSQLQICTGTLVFTVQSILKIGK